MRQESSGFCLPPGVQSYDLLWAKSFNRNTLSLCMYFTSPKATSFKRVQLKFILKEKKKTSHHLHQKWSCYGQTSLYEDENLVSYKQVHHAVPQIYDFCKNSMWAIFWPKGAHMSNPMQGGTSFVLRKTSRFFPQAGKSKKPIIH